MDIYYIFWGSNPRPLHMTYVSNDKQRCRVLYCHLRNHLICQKAKLKIVYVKRAAYIILKLLGKVNTLNINFLYFRSVKYCVSLNPSSFNYAHLKVKIKVKLLINRMKNSIQNFTA